MQVVLDTLCLSHLLRRPVQSRSQRSVARTSLDKPIQTGRLFIVIDNTRGLIDEWSRTCGVESVRVLVNAWERGIIPVKPAKIPPAVTKQLNQLGFKKTIDKLIIRVAIAKGKKIVTNDCDFWRPGDTSSVGQKNAPVALLCKRDLGLDIMRLQTLMREIRMKP